MNPLPTPLQTPVVGESQLPVLATNPAPQALSVPLDVTLNNPAPAPVLPVAIPVNPAPIDPIQDADLPAAVLPVPASHEPKLVVSIQAPHEQVSIPAPVIDAESQCSQPQTQVASSLDILADAAQSAAPSSKSFLVINPM